MTPYYEESGVTIYNADCREVLPSLSTVDAVITDPPYGMSYRSGANSSNSISSTGKRFTDSIIGDDGPFDPTPWIAWPAAFTGAQWFYDRLPAGGSIHTWNKRGDYKPLDQADADQIWCSVRKPSRILGLVWRGLCRHSEHLDPIVHPTQKPVELMAWMMVELCDVPEGALVLDPFMGSGTTLRAAKDLGRKAIGIEIEERYCEIAANRLRQEVLQFA